MGCDLTKRSKNWSEVEKSYLLDLIRPDIKIIEYKNNQSIVNRRKQSQWMKIHAAFCAKYGDLRTLKQLKEQWKQMKVSAKKTFSERKKEASKSGGGHPPPDSTAVDTEIYELIPAEFQQMCNPFDDDASSDDGAQEPDG